MADDAVTLAEADVDFTPYDNDGNGFVDAFIVVHAGRGGEETGAPADIWSHKWVLPAERSRGQHEDLRLPDHPGGRQARRHRARDRPPGLRLAGPLRHRQHLRGHRQLVPDGVPGPGARRRRGRCIRRPGASRPRAGSTVVAPATNADADDRGRQDRPDRVPAVEGRRRRATSTSWSRTGSRPACDASLPGAGLLVWHIDEAIAGNTQREPLQGRADAGGRPAPAGDQRQPRGRGRPVPGIDRERRLRRDLHPEQPVLRRAPPPPSP